MSSRYLDDAAMIGSESDSEESLGNRRTKTTRRTDEEADTAAARVSEDTATEDNEDDASESDASEELEPEELSDEDLELIEDNLAAARKRTTVSRNARNGGSVAPSGGFKRLRRRNEVESSGDDQPEVEAEAGTETEATAAEGRNKRTTKPRGNALESLFDDEGEQHDAASEEEEDATASEDDLDDFIEDEDDEGDKDFLPSVDNVLRGQKGKRVSTGLRRRNIIDDREAPQRALSAALAAGQISRRAWEEMMEIFGDGSEYADLVVEDNEESADEGLGQKSQARTVVSVDSVEVEEALNGGLGALDVKGVDAADSILAKDIPERFLGRFAHDKTVAGEEEALEAEARWISRRLQVREEDSSSSWIEGRVSAINAILRLFHQHKLEVPFIATYRKEYFQSFFELDDLWRIYDADEEWHGLQTAKARLLKTAGEDAVVLRFLECEAEGLDEPLLRTLEESLFQRRKMKTSMPLARFMEQALPTIEELLQLLRNESVVVRGSAVDVESLAVEMASVSMQTIEGALAAAEQQAVVQFGTDPFLLAELRAKLEPLAMLTVTPTPKGRIELADDATHPLAPIQFVTRKPPRAFVEDQGLLLAKGLNARLLAVDVEYGPGGEALLAETRNAFIGKTDSAWAVRVFERVCREQWLPRLSQLTVGQVRGDSERWTAAFCQYYLQDELLVSPGVWELKQQQQQANESSQSIAVVSCGGAEMGLATRTLTVQLVVLDVWGRDVEREALEIASRNGGIDHRNGGLDHRNGSLDHRNGSLDLVEEAAQTVAEKLADLQPTQVLISGWSPMTAALHRSLGRRLEGASERRGLQTPVLLVADDAARVFSDSSRASSEFPETTRLFRYCVGVGRRWLNPLVELAQATDEELLALPFHPHQDVARSELRLKHLHRALVNVVNLLGVPLVAGDAGGGDELLPGQRKALLRHVSGLGPRLAAHVMASLLPTETRGALRRSEASAEGLGPRLFMNCAGFLRLRPGLPGGKGRKKQPAAVLAEPLDGTRVHPESYELAHKMAADALELVESGAGAGADEHAAAIRQIQAEAHRLDDLLLEEYAKEIARRQHLPKHLTLLDVKAELQEPFADPRQLRAPPGPGARLAVEPGVLLKMLTGRDEREWWPGRAVAVRLLSAEGARAVLPEARGLDAVVVSSSSLGRRRGGLVQGTLVELDVRRLVASVSLERTEERERRRRAVERVVFDPFYDFSRASDARHCKDASSGAAATQSAVWIGHASFRAMDRLEAGAFLQGAPIGDYLLHPSGAGHPAHLPGRLTLTWKVAEGLLQHLPLGEVDVADERQLGRTLLLPSVLEAAPAVDRYEDLDEIVMRRIEPIVSLLQETRACPKFFNCLKRADAPGQPSDVEARARIVAHLRHLRDAHPSRVPYCLSLAPAPHAGHVLLSHLGGKRFELVRVDPRGFALAVPGGAGRLRVFERIDRLVDYFKAHYKEFCELSKAAAAAGGSGSRQETQSSAIDKYTQFANEQ